MEKPVCEDRRKSGILHKQNSDVWVYGSDARRTKQGAPKAPLSPGKVGIIDGEREPLPE